MTPTYTTPEVLKFIDTCNTDEQKVLLELVESEKRMYCIVDLYAIIAARDAKWKQWAKEDADVFKKIFGL